MDFDCNSPNLFRLSASRTPTEFGSNYKEFSFYKYKSKNDCSIRRKLFADDKVSLFKKTRKTINKSVQNLNSLFNYITSKIGSVSQTLRINSSYKKYNLDEDSAPVFQTPLRRARSILGRTPIKLYSPFGIETPGKFK